MLKLAGGIFLIIGAVIGGGIIAIPIASAKFGFYLTFLLIVLSWAIMTKTGLYVLSSSLKCPEKHNTYYSIVGHYLGRRMQWITILLYLTLLYFTLSSYISGCVSLFMAWLFVSKSSFSYFFLCFLYVLIFGGLITLSHKLVVRGNVLFVSLKVGLLILVVLVSSSYFKTIPFHMGSVHQSGLSSLALITINAFGFHFIIPSLVTYYGREHQALYKPLLITSTSIVAILYLIWLFAIYSFIPMHGEDGLIAIYHSSNQIMAFNKSLQYFLQSDEVVNVFKYFQIISLFGSFFCVSLGVFDFLVDAFKAQKRFMIGLLTFLPPLLLTLISENMYLMAMAASGYLAIVLEIVLPAWTIRTQEKSSIFNPIKLSKLAKSAKLKASKIFNEGL